MVLIALAVPGCGDGSGGEGRSPRVPGPPSPGPRDAVERGVLRVEQLRSEEARRSGRRYVEGAVPYVHVATPGGKTVVERGFPRAQEASLLVAEHLTAGRYVVETYVRPGSGAGQPPALDPPRDRCRTKVELPRSGSVIATVARTPGRACEIRVEHVGFADLVSLALDDARAIARRRGFDLRVVERDGEPLAVTMDLRFDRVNVAVESGRVSSLRGIG